LVHRRAPTWYFITSVMESDVEFVAADNPHANKLTIHILAAVAEHEREAISERTKAALAAAKRRGVKLGGMRGKSLEQQAEALKRAKALRKVFAELADLSHRGAAKALNERGLKTATGKAWGPVQVTRVRERLGLVTR
jgi:DNA invertase Pin-like site-specific DNA recombinase